VKTLTTAEAARLAGVDPRVFRRWARNHNLEPLHRVRIGRSTVTVWSEAELLVAGTRAAA
jgi:hypothetical protein